MPRRHLPVKKLLLGALVAYVAGAVWKEARRFVSPPAQPARRAESPPPATGAGRAPHRLPVGKLAVAFAALALLAAGMASPAGLSSSLEAPARLAHPVAGNPLGEAAAAYRHFDDLPLHIVTPPRQPALPVPRPSERTIALARYASVLGPASMLEALASQRDALAQRLLADSRVHIYPGGRDDLASGKVDPRISAVIEYLADTYGEVSVSCLISGHSYYVHQTKRQKKLKLPRVVSAHVSGRAVDISSVAGIPILGHQQPGGITEQTIRQLLALPDWIRPQQIISLLDLGGPSFPLPDHVDHIHIGY